MITHIYKYLLRHHWLIDIITLAILSRGLNLSVYLIIWTIIGNTIDIGGVQINSWPTLVGSVTLEPCFETIICFALVFGIFDSLRHTDKRPQWVIFTSALLFAVAHSIHSLIYPIVLFLPGLIYAFSYYFFKRTQGVENAIIFVTMIHALDNLIALLPALYSMLIIN